MSAISPSAGAEDRHGWINTETVETRFGRFEFENGYPTRESAEALLEQLKVNRAIEVYLTQLPAVALGETRRGMREFGAVKSHQAVVWEDLLDAQTLVLTANTETVYGMGFLDLETDGPTVFEAPPKMLGVAMDILQHYLVDFGPLGPDRGNGGKYLFLPPGYEGKVPDGYFVVKSGTYSVNYFLRGFKVDGKTDEAVALMKQLNIYPLAQAKNAPTMEFLNGSHQPIDTIHSDTITFFERLAQIVDEEPADVFTPFQRFHMEAIGIVKGKPFAPDEKTRALLGEAARAAAAIARANCFASNDPETFKYDDRQWQCVGDDISYTFIKDGVLEVDRRAFVCYMGLGNSPAMMEKNVGKGSQYLWTYKDAGGDFLDGAKSYRLRIPADTPVNNFWSVLAYDSLSRSELKNGQDFPSVSQYSQPKTNADGTVDVYFGPKMPPGQEKNWIKTVPGKGWFPIFRFYGPLDAFFDKSWKLDDIEKLDAPTDGSVRTGHGNGDSASAGARAAASHTAAAKTGAVTPEEAKAIAREGYLFGLPAVYDALTIDVDTNVASPHGMQAPLNQFGHMREFPDAKANPIVGMNVDTLYSLARLDLSKEPLILSVPEMGNRWWIMQVLDLWNDVPAAPGSRTNGGRGGHFALTGPDWQGRLPSGVAEVRVDTNLAMLGGRTYTAGKSDDASVHAIQDRYALTPLSAWGTDYEPPANVRVKPGIDTSTSIPKQVFALPAEEFFARLAALLAANPARPDDAPMLAKLAKLGIAPGRRSSLSSFDEDVRRAIDEGVRAAQQDVLAGKAKMGEMVNGWQLARDLGRYGTRYAYRATWTYFAVGGNLVEDALYPLSIVDGDGRPLDGTNRYTLTFPKGELPPVEAFWSVTMYDAESFLVPNALDRYALGDRDALKMSSDGSLTFYVQADSPGRDKEDNWLPAPRGPFTLALRLYVPKKQVADGTWKPPAVRRVQ